MSSKTVSKRRYQPVDDVTLARKREYWRSKKREQRARKSSTKKKIGNENLGLCMSVVSDEPSLQIHKVDSDPSLHNHDISCKQEDTDAPINSSSSCLSLSDSEYNVTMVPCQKERWFQKTKLKMVLPKFTERSTNSLQGPKSPIKSSVTGSSNSDTSDAEFHPNSSLTHKTQTGMLSPNGKQLATSPQSHASMVLPVQNNQNKPQNCLKPLTSAECKVRKEQSFVHSQKRRTCAFASKHNTRMAMTEEEMAAKKRENWRIKKREQRAKLAAKLAQNREESLGQGQSSCIVNASSDNSKALRGINLNSVKSKCSSQTTLCVQDTKPNVTSSSSGILQPSSSTQTLNKSKVPQFAHTQKRHCQKPEEMAAKRRENWRIKKREQRAKLAAKLAQNREESIGQGQSSCIVNSSSDNSKALRGINLNSVKSNCSSQTTLYVQDTKPNLTSSSSVILQPSSSTQTLNKSKVPQFAHTQKRHCQKPEEMAPKHRENWRIKKQEKRLKLAAKLAQNQEGSLGQQQSSCIVNASSDNSKALRGINLNSVKSKCSSRTTLCVQDTKANLTSSSSGVLQPSSITQTLNKSKVPQYAHTQKRDCQKPTRNSASKVESPEDRHARRKEYWRIKKREQRAMKARLKEQGTLQHHERDYHNSSIQMCGVQVSRAGAFTSSSDTIGGFIKEDGTVTFSSSKTTSDSSLSASHDFSNVKLIDKVGLQVQVSLPLEYSDDQPVTKDHQNSLVKSSLDRDEVKRERASRAACLGNGLLRSKISVLKQRMQNNKSNKRDRIASSINKIVCDSSTSAQTSIKELINPPIHAVFSIQEITPCISVEDGKPSPCPSSESHFEPPAAVNHHATTLQAVASMKKESVCSPKDNNDTEMHINSATQPLQLSIDDLLASENAEPNFILQQNVLLECDISENTSLKDINLSPQAFISEDTSHKKINYFCQGAADGSHALSPVAVQPHCRNTEKFSDDGAYPKQSCPSQARQKQELGESNELQRKREYWRSMKRQQRARNANANRDAAKDGDLHNLSPQKKLPSTPLLLSMSQDTSTCRKKKKKTRRCTKPAGPQTESTDKSSTDRSQIVATANPQDDPQEAIDRRRMQWRIKKQEQRARKAAIEKILWQPTLPPQGQASDKKTTSFGSAVVQSKKSEDHKGYLSKPCKPALKEESLNCAMEGPLSQDEWRNLYLMDPDPVNLLLVCMVCGEQMYSLSVEGVKAHIEEVHPNTQSLGDLERQGILDAWDKQVAIREHFITNQLQQ